MTKFANNLDELKESMEEVDLVPRWLNEVKDKQGQYLTLLDQAVYSAYFNRLREVSNSGDKQFIDEDGNCFITYPDIELARKKHVSVSSITSTKKKLTDLGLVVIKRQRIGNRWGNSRIYLSAYLS